MKYGRVVKRLISVGLVTVLSLGLSISAFATEVEEDEDSQLQKDLDAAYAINIESNERTNWPEGPETYGESAIVMEVGTGAILYEKNIDAHQYPASITKLLTTLVALKYGSLSDKVVFSGDSVDFLEPGDSSIGLDEGDEISLAQALYATLLASANEAAYAVGESVGTNAGHDYQWFIDEMNATVEELGGHNSNFVNTNGLHDEDHYTCARDMALIGRELFKYEDFFTISQTKQYTIEASDTVEEHTFQQHHKMLYEDNSEYYEYFVGGKTGYTSDAKSTLVTMTDKDGFQLVCVVLRTYGKNVYPDSRNLLEYVYNNFSKVSIADHETSADIGSYIDAADAGEYADEAAGYVVLPDSVSFADLDMELVPDENAQETGLATVRYSYEDTFLGSARVNLSESYMKAHYEENDKETTVETMEEEEKVEQEMPVDTIILYALFGVLGILLIALIIAIVRYRGKKKRGRRQLKLD